MKQIPGSVLPAEGDLPMHMVRSPKRVHKFLELSGLPLEQVKLLEQQPDPPNSLRLFCFRGEEQGRQGKYFLKYTDLHGVDIAHEAEILKPLQQDPLAMAPRLVEVEAENAFLVTAQMEGVSLSEDIQATGLPTLDYCYELGRTLARVHQIGSELPEGVYTRFHDIPRLSFNDRYQRYPIATWLENHKPDHINRCFIHGDFQLNNILWRDGKVCGILDWELAGMGNREWDIAFAMIQRPMQKILRSDEDREKFLEGYGSLQEYERDLVGYYKMMIYSWLLESNDPLYSQFCRSRIGAEILRWQNTHRTVTRIKPILEKNKKLREAQRKAPIPETHRWGRW